MPNRLIAESHVLLLNKFNIVPWHCLVVTSEFQLQLDDLNAADLATTWRVLQVRGLSLGGCWLHKAMSLCACYVLAC